MMLCQCYLDSSGRSSPLIANDVVCEGNLALCHAGSEPFWHEMTETSGGLCSECVLVHGDPAQNQHDHHCDYMCEYAPLVEPAVEIAFVTCACSGQVVCTSVYKIERGREW